ncbi:MAG: GRAM domain-containing protein [Pyrinomonadaceae bacterium]
MIRASFGTSFITAGLPFGMIMGVAFFSLLGIMPGLIAGVVTGTLFGLTMVAFVRYQSQKFISHRPALADERVAEEGPANHFLNGEGVGGWLYLTEKRLLFRSHSVNIQTHELEIRLDDIEILTKAKSLGLIPNQLHVRLNDGTTERFVLSHVDEWIRQIDKINADVRQ